MEGTAGLDWEKMSASVSGTGSAPVYACMWARQFPAQAMLRLRPELRDKPVAVIEGERPLEHIRSINRHARKLGLREGMTRAEAEMFDILPLRRSPVEESTARAALLSLYSIYTPRIEERHQENHCIHVLDITGTQRLFGTPQEICRKIRATAKQLGFALQIAISANFHTVLCIASAASGRIIHVVEHEEASALKDLPLATLHASGEYHDEFQETFKNWGLTKLGDLAALPEVELIARLGQQGRKLRQMARGEYPYHFQPMEAPFTLEEFFEFDAPVELLDSLLFVLNSMVEQVVLRAAARTFALAAIHTTLLLEGNTTHTTLIRPALPTQDRHSLLKLLQLELAAHPPPAAVLAISLRADPGPVSKVQLGLFTPQSPEPMRLEITLARISAIVGEGCVGQPCLQDSHKPDAHTTEKFEVLDKPQLTADAMLTATPALRRLRPPLDLGVLKSRPSSLWYQNSCYRIERIYGPWTRSGEWWSADAWSSDSWDFAGRSEDGGLLLGILSHDRLHHLWRLEAVYD